MKFGGHGNYTFMNGLVLLVQEWICSLGSVICKVLILDSFVSSFVMGEWRKMIPVRCLPPAL